MHGRTNACRMDDTVRAQQALLAQSEVVERLQQQRDDRFSELRGHWEATDRNPSSDHVLVVVQGERERQLHSRYRQKVDELMDAVHRLNILMYRWLEVAHPRCTGNVDEQSSLLRKKND